MNTDTGTSVSGKGAYVPLSGARVRREFSPAQAQTPVSTDGVLQDDQYALFLAQKAYEYTSATVTQARLDDGGTDDKSAAAGKVAKQHDYPEGEVSLQADFRGGKVDVVHRRTIGSEVVTSFFRQDGDCKLLGYDDGVSAVEVMVDPNGALTVFTDL